VGALICDFLPRPCGSTDVSFLSGFRQHVTPVIRDLESFPALEPRLKAREGINLPTYGSFDIEYCRQGQASVISTKGVEESPHSPRKYTLDAAPWPQGPASRNCGLLGIASTLALPGEIGSHANGCLVTDSAERRRGVNTAFNDTFVDITPSYFLLVSESLADGKTILYVTAKYTRLEPGHRFVHGKGTNRVER
jgi:hypothetical protein